MAQDYLVGGVPHNAFDISIDGTYLYIAIINASTGFPQVLKMSAELDADATVSYNPGAGTEICLQAGNFSPYFVWAVGAFGGTSKAVLSQDEGSFWYVMDPGDWTGVARPILVGPSNDLRITTSTGNIIQQSYVEGETDEVYWLSNTSMRHPAYSLDKIDDNLDEIITGAYWYPGLTEIVEYSPNEGNTFEDITKALPNDVTVTTVLMGRRG